MPTHQSNINNNNNNANITTNNNNSYIYSKHKLLTFRTNKINNTQIIETTSLSNNQINNHNTEHKHTRLTNNNNNMKTHLRTKVKNMTQPKNSQHNSKHKAYESGPLVPGADAPLQMGGSSGGSLQQHTSLHELRSSQMQMHHWTPGHTFNRQPQSNNFPKIQPTHTKHTITSQQRSSQTGTHTTTTQQQNQPQTKQQQQQQQQQQH